MAPLVLALASLAVACSSSSSNNGQDASLPCNEDPFQCAAGQTCWIKDTSGDFACLNSAAGMKGDACKSYVGSPTCGDGLLCFQANASGGTCVSYCDPNKAGHGCAADETCVPLMFQTGGQVHACIPNATQGDSGTPQDSGGGQDSGGQDGGSHDAGGDQDAGPSNDGPSE